MKLCPGGCGVMVEPYEPCCSEHCYAGRLDKMSSYRVDATREGFTLTPIKDDGFGRVTHDKENAKVFETFAELSKALSHSTYYDIFGMDDE